MKISKTSFNESRNSPEKYFQWRVERSMPTVKKIKDYIKLKNANVLEIGCGYGPLTSLLLKEGANVSSTEIDQKSITLAKKFLGKNSRLKLYKVRDEKLPFKKEEFDMVVLFDVIEHVQEPKIMIEEIKRVLKACGLLYLEFTPYYSLIGHHLYDYTKLPFHLFPHSDGIIKKTIFKKKNNFFFTSEQVWQQYRELNKIRISEVQNMIRDLKTLKERYILKYPDVFEINIPFLYFFGFFKDYFCFTFEGFYKK